MWSSLTSHPLTNFYFFSPLSLNLVYLDLNYLEKASRSPELFLAVNNKSGKIVMTQMGQKLPLESLSDVLDLGKAGCEQVHELLKKKVKQYSLSLKY